MADADRFGFCALVAERLAAHPEWLGDVMRATHEGMALALEAAHEARAKADAGMLAALSLASNKSRLSPATRTMLNKTVCAAINPVNASAIEKEFLNAPK